MDIRPRLARLTAILCILPSTLGLTASLPFTVFGPAAYIKTGTAPEHFSASFTVLNPGGAYRLEVYNGGLANESRPVRSATVWVNGKQVFRSDAPAAKVVPGRHTRVPLTLDVENALEVEMEGGVGATLAIDVVGIDADLPLIEAHVSPPPNPAGWNDTSLTVIFTCEDATSGIESCSRPVSVETEGPDQVVTGQAQDVAGNTALASITVSIDKTAPVVAFTSPRDQAIVLVSPVEVDGTFADASPLDSLVVCGQSITPVSPFQALCPLQAGPNTITVSAVDIAGNLGGAQVEVILRGCTPGSAEECYDGPDGTEGTGTCIGGSHTCTSDGSGYGPCIGQHLPGVEVCNGQDEDCNGEVDNGTCNSAEDLPSADRDPCAEVEEPCKSAHLGPYVVLSILQNGGVSTIARSAGEDVLYLDWVPQDAVVQLVVTVPGDLPGDPVPLAVSLPSLSQANVAAVVVLGLNAQDSDYLGDPFNRAGCDEINEVFWVGSCYPWGACCDAHDVCINQHCTGDGDSGNLTVCFGKKPRCSPACMKCHKDVLLCYSRPLLFAPGKSDCCKQQECGKCGDPQVCFECQTTPGYCQSKCDELQEACQGMGNSHGDPHLITFDKLTYDFQGAGEFVLARSLNGDLEVQARMVPWKNSTLVSINSAIAMNVSGDRVGVYLGRPLSLYVNGTPQPLPPDTILLPNEGKVSVKGKSVSVEWPADDARVDVTPFGSFLNAKVVLEPARKGAVEGLLGNFDDDHGNDLAVRNGPILGRSPSSSMLYGEYADSWRVTQKSSLFDYQNGAMTDTYVNKAFPGGVVTTASLSAAAKQAAEAVCKASGVDDPLILEACILDVALTGDPAFAEGAADVLPPVASVVPGGPAVQSGGLRLQLFDTPIPAGAVQTGFDGIDPGSFTVTYSSGALVADSVVVPVVNFPDTGFDQAAFYGVGPNGVVDPGSGATSPQGDDISIQPPGGNDTFGGSFTGYVYLPVGGNVTWTVGIDDFFDLIVNGQSAMKNLSTTNFHTFSTTVPNLPAGFVPITLNFGENAGEANVVLSGSGGGMPGGVIGPEFLAYSPTVVSSTVNVSTGVATDSTLLAIGADDDSYALVAGPMGTGTYPATAIVVEPHASWLTIPGTRWISRNLSKSGPNGVYVYQTQFTLPPTANSPKVAGVAKSDNNCVVKLNGTEIGQLSFSSFSGPGESIGTLDASLFVVGGVNTLSFEVFEGGSVTGLDVQGYVEYMEAAPAPSP